MAERDLSGGASLPTPVVAGVVLAALWLLAVPATVFVHELGPAATAGVLLAVVALIRVTPDGWRWFALNGVFWWSATQLVATLVPIRYPSSWSAYADRPSDGLRARRALAGE